MYYTAINVVQWNQSMDTKSLVSQGIAMVQKISCSLNTSPVKRWKLHVGIHVAPLHIDGSPRITKIFLSIPWIINQQGNDYPHQFQRFFNVFHTSKIVYIRPKIHFFFTDDEYCGSHLPVLVGRSTVTALLAHRATYPSLGGVQVIIVTPGVLASTYCAHLSSDAELSLTLSELALVLVQL